MPPMQKKLKMKIKAKLEIKRTRQAAKET